MKSKLIRIITNRYFLAPFMLLAWVTFFDTNHILSQLESRRQLHKLEEERDYYKTRIEEVRTNYRELSTNPQTMEKYARERYYMKKDNEEIFLVVEEPVADSTRKSSWIPGFIERWFAPSGDTVITATVNESPAIN